MLRKLRTILIDDEPNSLDALTLDLQFTEQVEIIGTYSDPLSGLKALQDDPPDLLFLDVEMPKMNGFELLHHLGPVKFAIIFVTAYSEYALKAFQVSAVDYLLKPVDEDDLSVALEKAAKWLQEPTEGSGRLQKLTEYVRQTTPLVSKIALPTLEGLRFVQYKDIVYCQADSNYTYVVLNSDKKILISKSLKFLEQKLPAEFFCRVHQSFLVNLNHIDRYVRGKSGHLVLDNGRTIPVARRKRDDFLSRF